MALPKGKPTLLTSAGNWTSLDNIWWHNTPDNPILCCDTVPAIRPPLADHLPIITILDLPFPRASTTPSQNFQMAEWSSINKELKYRLDAESPAKCIVSKEEFIQKVDNLVQITYKVLQGSIDKKSPNPYKQHWWIEELMNLKKAQNCLSNESHKFHHLCDHPAHAEYKAAANKFKEVMIKTCNQDWTDWLEGASQQDLYLANKYITSEPSN